MLDKTAAALHVMSVGGGMPKNELIDLIEAAQKEVESLRSMPEIVVLAGSARYKMTFEEESERLTLNGAIVLGKHVYKPGEEWDRSEGQKDMIHAVQFRKVDLANRVHVLNVDSYIGTDTYNLIMYALKNEVMITFYAPFIKLLGSGTSVTCHHFLQATRQRVEFEQATLG